MPMETLPNAPYTTIRMLGGMMLPMVDEQAVSATVNGRL